MTYIPYLGTFFFHGHGTPVWPWPVIKMKRGTNHVSVTHFSTLTVWTTRKGRSSGYMYVQERARKKTFFWRCSRRVPRFLSYCNQNKMGENYRLYL